MKKRAIALVILLLLTVQLASCASESPTAATTETETTQVQSEAVDATTTEEAQGFAVSAEKENLPQRDFGGAAFTMLIDDPNEQVWTYTNMVVESETGEPIDDAYYARNRLVENRFNIEIKQTITSLGNCQKIFKTSVQASDNAFDCAFLRYNDGAKLATGNFCVELSSLPYMDLTKPWWDKNSLKDLSIGGKRYIAASDITIADNDNTWLIYFDKQMVKDQNLDSPYNLVRDGKWTFDKFFEMMRTSSKDLNGDGKFDKKDQFGFLTHGENYAGFIIGAGLTIVGKDKDDLPYLNINNEKFISVWGKLVEIMNDQSCKANDIPFISEGLRNGQTLFGTEILKFVRDYRVNERDFGIVPIPKFDELQADYHTYVAVSAPMLIIPATNNDLEKTSIILEAMAAEGNRTIMPAYYEVSIRGKFVRDVESIEMLDIAFRTRMYDLGVVFNWGSISSDLSGLYGPKKNVDIASLVERKSGKFQAELQSTLDAFAQT